MGLFNRIASFYDDWYMSTADAAVDRRPSINPATGLPMTGGVDVAGNPFGIDLASHHEPRPAGSVFDDHHTGWHEPFPTMLGGGHDPWRD